MDRITNMETLRELTKTDMASNFDALVKSINLALDNAGSQTIRNVMLKFAHASRDADFLGAEATKLWYSKTITHETAMEIGNLLSEIIFGNLLSEMSVILETRTTKFFDAVDALVNSLPSDCNDYPDMELYRQIADKAQAVQDASRLAKDIY